jgi:hypothetical protein
MWKCVILYGRIMAVAYKKGPRIAQAVAGRETLALQRSLGNNLAVAETKAKSIADKASKREFAQLWGEAYEIIKERASMKSFHIPEAIHNRITELLDNPKLGIDAELRREIWRTGNTLLIELNMAMGAQDKERFKRLFADAKNIDDVSKANKEYIKWYVKTVGTGGIEGEGSEYFALFADKIDDEEYSNQDWYLAYMLEMLHQSAVIAYDRRNGGSLRQSVAARRKNLMGLIRK